MVREIVVDFPIALTLLFEGPYGEFDVVLEDVWEEGNIGVIWYVSYQGVDFIAEHGRQSPRYRTKDDYMNCGSIA